MKAIDLFAGAGGFTEGALAANIDVIWAANHNDIAVKYHRLNHPGTEVFQQDLQLANFLDVPKHDIMLASPCCQGHSKASGKKRNSPSHDKSRNTAMCVVTAAEVHRQDAIVVENVVDLLQWELYPAWLHAMTILGYSVAEHIVDAADYGVPQHRERLLLVCTRSKQPLYLAPPKQPHIPASSFIEWDDHPWRKVADKVEATQRRVAAGRQRFGDTFLAPFYGDGSGLTGRSLDRPVGTITTIDRWAVVRGDEIRVFQPGENRAAMGFRPDFILPKVKRQATHVLGNAVPPKLATAFLNELQRRM